LSLTFNEYQKEAYRLATYSNVGHNVIYPALGLAGESGEAADKIKKIWRNRDIMDANLYTDEEKVALAKEIGDVMWYIAAIASEMGYTLEEVAEINIDKLQDRRTRGVLKSEGDNR
jgi:NTP pyrophosphatase (non-canonical NTP hydrolase)